MSNKMGASMTEGIYFAPEEIYGAALEMKKQYL